MSSRESQELESKEDAMSSTRRVEVFSAGCSFCEDAVELVRRLACESCDVTVLSMSEPEVAERARSLGIRSVPAVVVDGKVASCCADRGIDESALRAAGAGEPLGER
jgi:glutaredoxin